MEEVDLEEVISNEKDKMIPKKDTKMKNPRGIEIEILNKGEDENQEVWKYNVPKQLEISDNVKKSIKNYYQQNNEFLSELKSAQERFSSDGENKINLEEEKDLDDRKKCSVQIAIYASFLVNIALFVFKIMALISSSSNSILASTVDSFLDLLAGSIIFVTNYFIKKKQVYLYPAGKSRIEPLGIIVFSSLMFSLSFQVLVEALRTIADLKSFKLSANMMSIIIIASTVVLKALLFIYCQCFVSGSSSVKALAEDHRNDVLTNSFGMLGFVLGSKLNDKYNDPRFKAIDPIFAICLSLFIMRNWFMTGKENVMMLSGRTAPDSFLKLLTFLAWNHHSKIKYIETVRAYHLAERYLVEIDIILDKDMPLSEAHDIGESLQKNIEELDEVERCWVHLDYEIQQDGGHNLNCSSSETSFLVLFNCFPLLSKS